MTYLVRILPIGLAGIMAAATPAAAEEVTLRAASCFPEGNFLSSSLEAFIADINEAGEGVVRINYVGGAPAIGSPFQLVDRISKGVFDLVGCTGAYYQNVLPEAEALKLAELPQSELRENGGFQLLSDLHAEKNLKLVARLVDDWKFYIFLNQEIDSSDLSGLRIRSVPIYTPFLIGMGATPVDTSISEIFPLMENGTVDGFGWPAMGFLPDWYNVTKYRVEPGIYEADIQLLFNMDTWNGLSDEAQSLIQTVAFEAETRAFETGAAAVNEEVAVQTERGIEPIVLSGAEAQKWSDTAKSIGWESVIANSPTHGRDLQSLLTAK